MSTPVRRWKHIRRIAGDLPDAIIDSFADTNEAVDRYRRFCGVPAL